MKFSAEIKIHEIDPCCACAFTFPKMSISVRRAAFGSETFTLAALTALAFGASVNALLA
jgi:hypothetical protein